MRHPLSASQMESDDTVLKEKPLQWRHNWRVSVSKQQPHDCLLSRLFRRRWKKTSKLRVTGLCTGNSPGTGEFPAQMASNAENVSIWWRHHASTRDQQDLYMWTCDISLYFLFHTCIFIKAFSSMFYSTHGCDIGGFMWQIYHSKKLSNWLIKHWYCFSGMYLIRVTYEIDSISIANYYRYLLFCAELINTSSRTHANCCTK